MAVTARSPKLSYAEYLALEAASPEKHEFVDGELWSMAGGSRDHGVLQLSVGAALTTALRGSPCRPAGSDARVYVPTWKEALYPDLHVVCGPARRDPADPQATTNPTLVIEVLSPSTEGWDRGGKFDRYASMPSVQEYALFSVDQERVEVFRRNADATWTRRLYRTGDTVDFASVGAAIPVVELYATLRAEHAANAEG